MKNNILQFAKDKKYNLTEKESFALVRLQETGLLSFELGLNNELLIQILDEFEKESIDKCDK